MDLDAVCDVTGSRDARLVDVERLSELFPGCEPGAAPPFGGLWNLPVIFERALGALDLILVPAGKHDGLLELHTADYLQLEQPQVASIAALPGEEWRHALPIEGEEPNPWHRP